MTKNIRVRFAPSPTGYLHIGGARTALYNYMYAKSQKGKFILRIEDTDTERSRPEYEQAMIDDFNWLGLSFDESPQSPEELGPYRQSERLDIYKTYADKLLQQNLAYACFLTTAELEELTNKAESEKKAPHFYHDKFRDCSVDEVSRLKAQGVPSVIRFKNPNQSVSMVDEVRGNVTFPGDMVGDFVIMRSSGMPVYNFCCALDDALMEISHVIRAEEHLPNTLRQILILNALSLPLPIFSHVSLLVGADRQKLSKRHGATSVRQYKDRHFLPKAVLNYLCLLGWSHPAEKDIFDVHQLDVTFDLSRFNKSPALYDIEKLNYFNGQYLHQLDTALVTKMYVDYCGNETSTDQALFLEQTETWQNSFCHLFVEKIDIITQFDQFLVDLFASSIELEANDDVREVNALDSTAIIRSSMHELIKVQSSKGAINLTQDDFTALMSILKKEHKIKGKPLFMGLRIVLTGKSHGADLKELVPLISLKNLSSRMVP